MTLPRHKQADLTQEADGKFFEALRNHLKYLSIWNDLKWWFHIIYGKKIWNDPEYPSINQLVEQIEKLRRAGHTAIENDRILKIPKTASKGDSWHRMLQKILDTPMARLFRPGKETSILDSHEWMVK